MDMIGLALKSMGFNPEIILRQAMEIGTAFERLHLELAAIRGNQEAIMVHLGLSIPEPTGEVMALIELESAKFSGPTNADVLEAAL